MFTHVAKANFNSAVALLLSQRDAGEVAAMTQIFTLTGQARGRSVPLDADGGKKTARGALWDKRRNAVICICCRLALISH